MSCSFKVKSNEHDIWNMTRGVDEGVLEQLGVYQTNKRLEITAIDQDVICRRPPLKWNY